MSEPSKTGGRPLDPTTSQLHQLESTTTPKQTSSHLNQPMISSISNQHKALKKTSPRRRPGTAQQAASGPHIGSSRPEQSASSPTNMTSHVSSVHYTRTGRISKAKKGLKVHDCENCGRVSQMSPSCDTLCCMIQRLIWVKSDVQYFLANYNQSYTRAEHLRSASSQYCAGSF